MNTKPEADLESVLQLWREEDRGLEICVDELRDWMREVEQIGFPHFGETATRLRPLRARLVEHFRREDELADRLSELYPDGSPEVKSVYERASRDHDQLLDHIDQLIDRLSQTDPPFASWQVAMTEVQLFIEMIDRHEQQEYDGLAALVPAEFCRQMFQADDRVS